MSQWLNIWGYLKATAVDFFFAIFRREFVAISTAFAIRVVLPLPEDPWMANNLELSAVRYCLILCKRNIYFLVSVEVRSR